MSSVYPKPHAGHSQVSGSGRSGSREQSRRTSLSNASGNRRGVAGSSLWRFCGHTAIVNSAALNALGIDEGISDPPSGSLGRDGAGRLDGSAKESAAEAIFRAIPQIDPETMAASLRETIEDSIRMGLTAVVEAAVGFTSGFDNEFAVWNLLRQDVLILADPSWIYVSARSEEAAARGLTPRRDPDWQGMTLKFFADGIVGARTAAVSKPFAEMARTVSSCVTKTISSA